VGRILATLKETGLERDTVLGFMSDNGGVMYTEPVATNNAPFKGGKALHFEGGIRVPLVFRWPGFVPANAWSEVPVSYEDIFPTLLDLAKGDPRARDRANPIDGRSLVPLLGDPTNAKRGYRRDTFYWHYPYNVIVKNPYDDLPSAPSSAIRVGDFKLIFDWSGALRLYNLARDPYEKEELSAAQPERAIALFRQLNDWLDANAGEKYLPALNPDYDPAKAAPTRPFVDLRRKYLGEARAIRPAAADPRFRIISEMRP
jgi:arylsulfatase A-like enzyme